jgi:hypothetical protein
MANEYKFPAGGGQEGLDSLKIKQALVDSFLPNKLNNIVNNQFKNPRFYENVAKTIAKGLLWPFPRVRDGDKESEYIDVESTINGYKVESSSRDYDIGGTEFQTDNGIFQNLLFIPNLSLISNYTQLNFFSTKGNVQTDEIIIDIPLCTLSYSYSNKYKESNPVGYNGTIKELIGTSNLSIKIEGVFTSRYLGVDVQNTTQNMPDVKEFQLMCMRNKVVTVVSQFIADKTILNDFFQDCVVKNFSLPGDNTSKNLQRFTLTLESDRPLDII